jgi:hypothetical protein
MTNSNDRNAGSPALLKCRSTSIRALLIAIVLGFNVSYAGAQGLGYVLAGPGGYSGFFGSRASDVHAAGGAELLIRDQIGFGGEVGLFNRLVVASFTTTVHLTSARSAAKLVPFVTAGHTVMGVGDGEGSFAAWAVAGGADYGFRKRRALRVEFRDNVRPDVRGAVQYWSVRAGVVFR